MSDATAHHPRLRVIHFSWSGRIGGIERILLDLTEAQASRNLDEPTILLGEALKIEEAFIVGQATVPVTELGLVSGFDFSLRKLLRAYSLFRSNDIVHLHAFNPAIAVAAVLSGRPIIYTEHGVLGGANSQGLWSWFKRRLFSVFVNLCVSRITCNSNFTKKRMTSLYRLRRKNVDVIYNGTRLGSEFAKNLDEPKELRDRLAGRFVIGTFSRLVPEKRVDRLVKAFGKLAYPSSASLLVVGDGPSRAALNSLARDLQLLPRTYFAGAQARIAPFIARMDVCVFPSQNEPFGLVALEALSAGKPTIVFNDGGGLVEIVESLNPDDIVSTEAQLADRIDFYRKCTEGSVSADDRRAHANTFSIERMAFEFQRIYTSVISQKPQTEPSGS